jgi:hypothetical protein
MKPSSEKILPEIKLKYFLRPTREDSSDKADAFKCHYCKEMKTLVGGGIDGHTAHPKVICEDCAIDQFQQDFSFKNREAAAARRRRIFDVGYLFQEMIFDEYLRRRDISYEALSEDQFQSVFQTGQQLFSMRFTKAQKVKLEEIVNQDAIERKLREALKDLSEIVIL